jgi:hypothetical protein
MKDKLCVLNSNSLIILLSYFILALSGKAWSVIDALSSEESKGRESGDLFDAL